MGCSRTRTITVSASNKAIIESVDVIDLLDENSITVILSQLSLGEYLFSIDDFNYQTSNTFLNCIPGIYSLFIKDIKGCGIKTKEINVLGIPKFFTPNEDGFNDNWNIIGFNHNSVSKVSIYIFNRHGNFLKELSPLGQGWDGKHNGQNAPSDDYWYEIKLEDGRISKGHFSLKR